MPAPTAPTISIVVSTMDGMPAIAGAAETFKIAAEAVGGEVVIVDGSGRPPPSPQTLDGHVTWLERPGLSVFQMRSIGYRAARAPIIAITEDHCRVPADWAGRMLDAHAAHQDAVAVGGSVENGATGSALDWASFLAVQATQMAPIPSGPADHVAGAVNVSYVRSALEGFDEFDGLGAMDVLHQRDLRGKGGLLVADDSIRVIHDQSLGWDGTVRIHYHAGRTFASFIRRRLDGLALMRLAGVLLIPYVRFARTMVVGYRKGYGTVLLRAWPLVLWLYLVQTAGQITGFVAGPGDSPRKVR
jgi:hypothetical protein